MSDLNLVQLFQLGTQTYDSPPGTSSTIDLVFTSERLTRDVLECKLHNTHHGSDHEAIESQFDLQVAQITPTPRFLFKSSPWEKIREDIQDKLREGKINASPLDLNEYTSQLLALVINSIQKWVPKAKPCHYSKRWWNVDPTALRSKFSRLRNQARRFRRLGQRRPLLERNAQLAKHGYQKAVKQAKESHWEAFLDNTENIWQAAKYLGDENSDFAPISKLKKKKNKPEAQNETEIAATLLSSFFPSLPPYPTQQSHPERSEITVPPFTEEEVKNAIFAAGPFSAGGIDNLPSIVWQKLWPVLNLQIFGLFWSSLSQGRLPD